MDFYDIYGLADVYRLHQVESKNIVQVCKVSKGRTTILVLHLVVAHFSTSIGFIDIVVMDKKVVKVYFMEVKTDEDGFVN